VRKCIALLRIADGLDYGHAQKAVITGIKITKDKVTVELADKDSCDAEVRASLRKSDMFQRVYGMELDFK